MGSDTMTKLHSKKKKIGIRSLENGEKKLCRWLASKQSHIRKYIALVGHEKAHFLGKQKEIER